MLTRRSFCLIAGALAGATLLPRRVVEAHLADGTLHVRELRDGVWLVSEGGGNVLVLRTGDGPVVVDAKVGAVAWELRDRVRDHGAAPRMLINTHHHGDHVGGNFIFEDVEIVAHRNLRPRLAATVEERVKPGLLAQAKKLRERGDATGAERIETRAAKLAVEQFAARREFDDTLELKVGGIVIHLHHFGHGHTDNDLVVHLPQSDVVHTGDLVFHELHPFIDRSAKANTRGWQKSTRATERLCSKATVVVPGHGEVGDVEALREQHRYFEQMRDFVGQAIDAGRSRDEVTALQPKAFASYGFEQIRPRALGAIHDEVMEERKKG